MSKIKSASQIKKWQSAEKDPFPKLGTHTREVFDRFYTNKGRALKFTFNKQLSPMLYRFYWDYGLDIRCVKRGKKGSPDSYYVLAGEWFEDRYVDYLAPTGN